MKRQKEIQLGELLQAVVNAAKGDFSSIKRMLESGVDINAVDDEGCNVVLLFIKMIPAMLEQNSDANAIIRTLEFLLDNDANFEARDNNGFGMLDLLLQSGNTKTLALIERIRTSPLDYLIFDKKGLNTLTRAAIAGKLEVVQFIINAISSKKEVYPHKKMIFQKGEDFFGNREDDQEHYARLVKLFEIYKAYHFAKQNKHDEVTSFLLEESPKLKEFVDAQNAMSKSKETTMEEMQKWVDQKKKSAVERGDLKEAEILESQAKKAMAKWVATHKDEDWHKMKVTARGVIEHTINLLVDIAIDRSDFVALEILKTEADKIKMEAAKFIINAADGPIEIIKWLAKDMSQKDLALHDELLSETALHKSCLYGNLEITQFLLKRMNPKDLAKKDFYGKTALQIAYANNRKEIFKLLVFNIRPSDLSDLSTEEHQAVKEAQRIIANCKDIAKKLTAGDMKNSRELLDSINHNFDFDIIADTIFSTPNPKDSPLYAAIKIAHKNYDNQYKEGKEEPQHFFKEIVIALTKKMYNKNPQAASQILDEVEKDCPKITADIRKLVFVETKKPATTRGRSDSYNSRQYLERLQLSVSEEQGRPASYNPASTAGEGKQPDEDKKQEVEEESETAKPTKAPASASAVFQATKVDSGDKGSDHQH